MTGDFIAPQNSTFKAFAMKLVVLAKILVSEYFK